MAQTVPLRLGNFIFSVNTATYDKLTRVDEWRWVSQERLNNTPAEQFVGWGSTVITIEGRIYPLSRILSADVIGPNGKLVSGQVVGTNQLNALRALANARAPQVLSDGRGRNLGQFVITKLHEDQEYILDSGAPRKQSFILELKSFGPDDVNAFLTASAVQAVRIAGNILTGITDKLAVINQTAVLPGIAAAIAGIAAGAGIPQAASIGMALLRIDNGVNGKMSATQQTTTPPAQSTPPSFSGVFELGLNSFVAD